MAFPSSAFGDSEGKFPGKGSRRVWQDANDIARIGQGFFKQGKNKEAVEYFRRAIARYPYDSGYYYYLGLILDGQGQLEESVKSYKAAVALEPGYAYAWNNMGCVYLKMKKLDLAENAAKKGFYFKHDSFEEASTLAEVYLAQKRYHDAYNMLMIAERCPDADQHKKEFQSVLEEIVPHLKTAER